MSKTETENESWEFILRRIAAKVAVQPYGGGLWHTWFDRDLGVAGRVVLRDEKSGKVEHRLVKIGEPILRVPNLAIHLNRDIYTEGFKVNFQTHMAPLLGMKQKNEKKEEDEAATDATTTTTNHHHHHQSFSRNWRKR